MIQDAMTSECWNVQVSKRVGISVVLTFLVQLVAFTWAGAWFASTIEARVSALETEQAEMGHVREDLSEMRADLRWIKQYMAKGEGR